MSVNLIILFYIIIHLLSVCYMYFLLHYTGHRIDFTDRSLIWGCAPRIVIVLILNSKEG